MNVFLSYNKADKDVARTIGAQLKLSGADVWFDEWEIRAGDSIPGKLDAGLRAFDTFALIWSRHAKRSQWVRAELEAAISRSIADEAVRLVPIKLDTTELPALLQRLRYVDLPDGADVHRAVMAILGIDSERDFLRAMQMGIEGLDLPYGYFHGYGIAFGCPRCGAGLRSLRGWHETDWARDDEYAGVRCEECGWNNGGEV